MKISRAFQRIRSVFRDRKGNTLMIFAIAIIPMIAATGAGVDYSRASRLQTKMNAAADAAALSAVTLPMMSQSSSAACTTAMNMFTSQVSGLSGLVFDPSKTTQLTITITDSASQSSAGTVTTCSSSGSASSSTTASYARTVTVTYAASSQNAFGGILGWATTAIGGSSQANSAVAPNIDFYIMIDTSPSMLLPATSAGLASLTSATGGCAFACHQTNLAKSSEVICDSKGQNCIDFYTVARNNNLVLRTDLVTEAVQDLTDVATTTSASNKAKYRMGLFDFDYMFRQIWPTASIAGFNVEPVLSNVKQHTTDATVLTYCNNNNRVCGVSDNDTATNFTVALTGATAAMPLLAGNGTNNLLDTPQAMLFIITDGMRDENLAGSRVMGPIPTAQCTLIKSRGIRIAILNTQYLPASASDSWSISNVKTPYLSPTDKITPALQSCASPGLFYQVTTDSDISTALATLFQKAVATAHLTQ